MKKFTIVFFIPVYTAACKFICAYSVYKDNLFCYLSLNFRWHVVALETIQTGSKLGFPGSTLRVHPFLHHVAVSV